MNLAGKPVNNATRRIIHGMEIGGSGKGKLGIKSGLVTG